MTAAAPFAAVDVALRDGSTVRVRPVVDGDFEALKALLGGLSEESRWLRFFTAGVDLDTMAGWASSRGGHHGYGVVATAGTPERIVGHAAYVPTLPGSRTAEIAFEVAEDRHGQGIGTILLAHLAAVAPGAGIDRFVATVHPSNHRMAQVLRDSGFPVDVSVAPGELHFELPASLDAGAIAAFEDRDRIAAVAAVERVLRPAGVALIGASRRSGTIGAAVLANLRDGGFRGRLYAVHPEAADLGGVAIHRRIGDVPGPIDLAVVAVRAEAVPAVARECGAAGVRALVVLSGGFAEIGEHGAQLQKELLEACRHAGMRLVGPNGLGVLNTSIGLNATFSPEAPRQGRIAFASQSGAFGIAAINEAGRRGLGISSFVSTGDKADLSGNDFLRYWQQDDDTDVILLYLESFGNPRRFGTIGRGVARSKPIVAVKSGRSAAGARAAASHTGALLAASDVTVDALFRHAGVVRVETVVEQLDVAALLVAQPLPRGDRVAIVTNAGGPGIACADACAGAGLRVEGFGEPLRSDLREMLPAHAAVANPVDMIAAATPEDFRRTIERVAADAEVDAVIAIFIPPLVTRADDVAGAVRAASRATAAAGVPLLAVYMAVDDAERAELAADGAVPAYATPEEAARALGHVARYAAWRRDDADEPPALHGVDPDAVAAVLARALESGGGWLAPADLERVLAAYGVPLVESRFAPTAAAAGRCAAELGGPVALKAVAEGLVHKSELGAVSLGLGGAAAVTREARAIARRLREAGHEPQGFVIQRMASAGIELIVGIVGDPDFGPVVACGAGGTAVELLGDVSVRLAPLGRRAAGAMLRSLRTFPLLDGYRGAERADVTAVEDVLLRVSALAAAHPEIAELDCNPLLAGPAGAVVLDARLRVAAPPAARPFPALDR
jgi:acetyl coenzyme A synthetase (ADP forming)-like protein